MPRRHITIQQLQTSYINALEISISAAAARLSSAQLCDGSSGSFKFNEVLCLCLCQVDFELRLSEVRWCCFLLSIDHA